MTAFLLATALVALAEMGDKTQLLAFLLAARFRQPVPIVLGIWWLHLLITPLQGLLEYGLLNSLAKTSCNGYWVYRLLSWGHGF